MLHNEIKDGAKTVKHSLQNRSSFRPEKAVKNRFNNFHQRSYSEDDLERMLANAAM